MKLPVVPLVLALFLPTAIRADDATTVGRLDTLGGYVAASAICMRLGYEVRPAELTAVQDAAEAQAVASGMSKADAQVSIQKSMDRNLALLKQDLKRVVAVVDSDGPKRPAVMALVAEYGRRCDEAAGDRLFSRVIVAKPAADQARDRLTFSDTLLEGFGEASWQTPKTLVRSDLYMTVGACKRFLSVEGLARYTDALDADGGLPERERAFYAKAYREGIESAPGFAFDATQCQRAIKSFADKLK